jgi:quinoprotein glucose dehydrogenase
VSAKADPAAAEKDLPALLKDSAATTVEKQAALLALGRLRESKPADEALAAWLDDLVVGKVPPELALDLLDAARARASASLKEKVTAYEKQVEERAAKEPLAKWRDVTHGGDAERGKQVFLNNAAVYCQRCHKFDGQGGDVGPELTGIGSKQTRDYLVEALVDPNKTIAKGFESVLLTLEDGRVVSGVLRSKTAKEYVLVTAEGKVLTVAKDDVAAERPDRSAMPDDLAKKLTRHEIRDLLEFLATSKETGKK